MGSRHWRNNLLQKKKPVLRELTLSLIHMAHNSPPTHVCACISTQHVLHRDTKTDEDKLVELQVKVDKLDALMGDADQAR